MTAPRAPFFPADLSIRASNAPIEIQRLGLVDYQEAWDYQAKLALQRANSEIEDQLLIVEHPSVYTAGKRTQPEDMPTNGLPVINADRGGRITWHGPGQLVIYPIVKLAEPIDVVDYVRRLEEALIHVVREMGVSDAGRIDGRSGVWVPAHDGWVDSKVAAIGIRITRGVAMHGVAINCNNTLDFYEHIVPCGIADAGLTTLSRELKRDVTTEELVDVSIAALDDALAGRLTVENHSFASASDPTKNLPKRG
ncbi:lipoyl(octanoyl) transferase LipB [Corynebacterium deserti]|nr:lipoyl(octanoyl) transferase LipB [Corynebacterium deserti]